MSVTSVGVDDIQTARPIVLCSSSFVRFHDMLADIRVPQGPVLRPPLFVVSCTPEFLLNLVL